MKTQTRNLIIIWLLLAGLPCILAAQTDTTYKIVDTGQMKCYNDNSEITFPLPGQDYYGQDAQFSGYQPSYTLHSDTLTVYDNNTGLTWQHSPDTDYDGIITYSDKLTWAQAQSVPDTLNAKNFGGYSDWRLPTIKELYSLINFKGGGGPGGPGSNIGNPFIDTNYFIFHWGFTDSSERIIDSQWLTRNLYVANTSLIFGVNFADGRIKAYSSDPYIYQDSGTVNTKRFHILCVHGNLDYGKNNFHDNDNSTITDLATGLMWTKNDSRTGMNWKDALAWVQTKNAQNYCGYSDWRMPNAKELQSIVDYTRSPNTTSSAAIDSAFSCTQITNEAYQTDYPWYWTSTSLGPSDGVYVCFGRALGYMNNQWRDVHGAGCQRSDPKGGDLSRYAHAGNGYYNPQAPQGDAIRIYNYVRLVRGGNVTTDVHQDGFGSTITPDNFVLNQNYPNPFNPTTTISFELPSESFVSLKVYNVLGAEVATLVSEKLSAGRHEVTFDASQLTSGMYFYRLSAGSPSGQVGKNIKTGKAALLK